VWFLQTVVCPGGVVFIDDVHLLIPPRPSLSQMPTLRPSMSWAVARVPKARFLLIQIHGWQVRLRFFTLRDGNGQVSPLVPALALASGAFLLLSPKGQCLNKVDLILRTGRRCGILAPINHLSTW
jgi:hypothetical protein